MARPAHPPRLALLAGLLALAGAAPAAAQSWRVSGEATLGSELSDRGLALWPDEPVAQGLIAVSDTARWSAALAVNVPLGGTDVYQTVATTARYWSLSNDWQTQVRLGVYLYPGNPELHPYDRAELTAGAAFRDLLSLEVSARRMREVGERADWAVDLGLRWPLSEQWALAGGLGRSDMAGWPGVRYTYADAGLAWQAGPWRATLRSLWASRAARDLLGEYARTRASASLTYTF